MHPEIFLFRRYARRDDEDKVTMVAKFNAAVGPFRLFGCHLYLTPDGEFSIQPPPYDDKGRGIGLRASPLRNELLALAVRHYEFAISTLAAGVISDVSRDRIQGPAPLKTIAKAV